MSTVLLDAQLNGVVVIDRWSVHVHTWNIRLFLRRFLVHLECGCTTVGLQDLQWQFLYHPLLYQNQYQLVRVSILICYPVVVHKCTYFYIYTIPLIYIYFVNNVYTCLIYVCTMYNVHCTLYNVYIRVQCVPYACVVFMSCTYVGVLCI